MAYTSENLTIPSANIDLPAQLFVPSSSSAATDSATVSDAAGANGDHQVPDGDGTSPRPGLVVLHDHYGPDDFTHQTAARLASLGYIVVTPDLFTATGAPADTSDNALLAYTLGIPDSRLVDDTLAALDWLTQDARVDASRLGIVGWGWGGAYALMAAAHDARVQAAADIAGHLTYPVLTAQKPGSPLNFVGNIEGALLAVFPGKDPLFPEIEVERLVQQLTDQDRRGEVKIYDDAPPRFWRDENLSQTRLLWRRLENFLAEACAEPETYDLSYPNEESRLHA
jgi:dienelactone hydrolase